MWFGLQAILAKLTQQVTGADWYEAKDLAKYHVGPGVFNADGWAHLIDDHGGKLPLRITAAPEGLIVPEGNVLMTVENTCPQCFWLTNYMETILAQVWYPLTVATESRECKRAIKAAMEKTGCDLGGLDFKLHDFGYRGVSSSESAGLGGCGHLVNFRGTDTLAALEVARVHYNHPCAGFSIPAAEHSTITSWGQEYEEAAYRNMLTQYPESLVAVVSDSYDLYEACEKFWCGSLYEEVMKRKGTLVVRPDSGYPPEVVCKVLSILEQKYSSRGTPTGHKLLPPCIRVIQGDGVDYGMIKEVLRVMEEKGWAADNVGFGMGGALLQKLNRDTQRCAFKCSAIEREGRWRPVSKDPRTDPSKASKAGRLKLVPDAYTYATVMEGAFAGHPNLLEPVFENGQILKRQTLEEIRERARV